MDEPFGHRYIGWYFLEQTEQKRCEMSFFYEKRDGVLLLRCRELCKEGVIHAFSTRIGGVSQGTFESMNLGLSRGDSTAAVEENYRRFLKAAGICGPLYRVAQIHSDLVHEVPYEVAPKAGESYSIIFDGRPPLEGDGMVTAAPHIALAVYYADCMPILLFDPLRRVCAAVHSGWRGTVRRIAARAVEKLSSCYGTRPGDVIAAVGPSVSPLCYEVSEEVAEAFRAEFGAESGTVVRSPDEILHPCEPELERSAELGADSGTEPQRGSMGKDVPLYGAAAGAVVATGDRVDRVAEEKKEKTGLLEAEKAVPSEKNARHVTEELFQREHLSEMTSPNRRWEKPHIDLWRAAELALLDAGVPKEQIHISRICTVQNVDCYFSHRVMGDARGNNAAVIMLTDAAR